MLVLPLSDYCIDWYFLSNNLTSPANYSENICWGENLIGADVKCEYLKDPYGYYKALGCKKISSDEDIGVALKKAKKGFFVLGRTWKVQQKNIHCVEELVLRGIQEASKTFQVQDLIHWSESAREMGSNGGTHHWSCCPKTDAPAEAWWILSPWCYGCKYG